MRKQIMRRLLAGTAAGLFILLSVAGCKTDSGTETPSDSGTNRVTEPATEPVTDAPVITEIAVESLKQMQMVYPQKAGDALVRAIGELVDQINRTYGIEMMPVTDEEPVAPGGEILIGETNRAASKAYTRDMRYDSFGYTLSDGNVLIAGGTEDQTVTAVTRFKTSIVYLRRGGKNIFFKEAFSMTESKEYPLNSLQINGVDIRDWQIVYPSAAANSENLLANRVMYWIRSEVGYELKVVSDKTPAAAHEIRIGKTNREGAASTLTQKAYEGSIIGASDSLTLTGNEPAGLAQATETFLSDLFAQHSAENGDAKLAYVGEGLATPGDTLTVMSFNVFYINTGIDRAERVVQNIYYAMPDVFGIQEGTDEYWVPLLTGELSAYYASSGVGEGRPEHPELCHHPVPDDEHDILFYNKAKFELVSEGHGWLSDTPDVPSKYPQANWPRIANWVVLRRKSDGKVFVYANTHLDEAGDRDKQATALTKLLDKVSAENGNCPVFCTGDFNQEYWEGGYKNMAAGGYMDSGNLALEKRNYVKTVFTPWYGEYNPTAGNKDYSGIIDFCWSKFIEKSDILYAHVFTEPINGNYPSDHYSVYFRFRLA